jgi:hypothetical protein
MNPTQRLLCLGIAIPMLLLLSTSCSAVPPVTEPTAAANEKVIGHGAELNIKDHLVSGKTVIFDFFSEYCPPCQYNLQSIPHFKIYSPEGKLVAEDEEAFNQVLSLLDKEGIK